ncbi:hypothetical protein NPIL_549961 [Nephila pilipes]|uniref:Uncharacterized protein n=1 Tax=Nephila pilipes TaxID=299642 RepID=A0A8X6QAX8_NEPPI|nr:hypothetical protein NPIL_549961 [Nephila pilipes]
MSTCGLWIGEALVISCGGRGSSDASLVRFVRVVDSASLSSSCPGAPWPTRGKGNGKRCLRPQRVTREFKRVAWAVGGDEKRRRTDYEIVGGFFWIDRMKWRRSLRAGQPGAVVVPWTGGEEVGELWPCGARGLRVRFRAGDSGSGVRGVGDPMRGQGVVRCSVRPVRVSGSRFGAWRSGLYAVVSSSAGALP